MLGALCSFMGQTIANAQVDLELVQEAREIATIIREWD